MEELKFYWSSDGQTVIIIDDDGNEEQVTREEFLEMDIAEEPYHEENQRDEALERYYEKYFEDDLYDPSQSKKPTRPIRDSIYDSNRWRGLKKVENFLRIEDRELLLESLKKKFQLSDAAKGYYSLLLELTYLGGDLSWAKSARDNQIDENEEVIKMLRSYHLEGLGVDFQVIKAQERMRQALEELDKWHALIGLPALSPSEKELQVERLTDPKCRKALRVKASRELRKISSPGLKRINSDILY